jgi:hypothetical protein
MEMSLFLLHSKGLLEFYMRDMGRYASEGSHEQKLRNTLQIGLLLNNHLKCIETASGWVTVINIRHTETSFHSNAPALKFKLFTELIQNQYKYFS